MYIMSNSSLGYMDANKNRYLQYQFTSLECELFWDLALKNRRLFVPLVCLGNALKSLY